MRSRAVRWYVFFFALTCVAAALSPVILSAIWRANRVRRCASCCIHLTRIGVALHVYHSVHGCFPPASTVGRAGRPMHSWRVLLLPYLGESDLYSRYRLDEPWNSDNNRRLAKLMPECYRCPADTSAAEGTTSYVAVVSAHAAWRPDKALSKSDITDGISDTIMVVEVSDCDINWMQPRDLTLDEASAGVSAAVTPGETLSIRSRHTSVVNCAFGDACAHSLKKDISPTLLRGLLTADGAEDVSEFFRREQQYLPSLVD